ncbi:MAG: Hydrolase [Microgenomates group bacterium GW2011_GWF2_47_9]|nr:MAG: Hydrolase [Microgenomates group bacterium GW2011_GWF2_47_9]
MYVRTLPVGPLTTNCYLIEISESSCFVVDPGDEGDYISEKILKSRLSPLAILLTHAHFDHVLGLLPLHLNFPDTPIFLHPLDQFLYNQAVKSAKYWVSHYTPDPLPKVKLLSPLKHSFEGLKTIHSPGHTPGSVSYYFPTLKSLFPGDTLTQEPVNTSHKYSSLADLTHSHLVLKSLPPSTIVYPGHGQSFAIPPKEK